MVSSEHLQPQYENIATVCPHGLAKIQDNSTGNFSNQTVLRPTNVRIKYDTTTRY